MAGYFAGLVDVRQSAGAESRFLRRIATDNTSIGGWINPAALMRCDLENASHPFREGNQSLHLFIMLGSRRLLHRAPTGDSRPLSSPLVGDTTHENSEETDKRLSGPPDSMIASQRTETEAGLEISITAAGNQESTS